METIYALFNQLAIMAILVSIGYLLFSKKLISKEGTKTLANIQVYLVLPVVIIRSFLVEHTPERLSSLGTSMLVSVAIMFLAIFVSKWWFKEDGVAAFASSFSNPGFFGVPIIMGLIGIEGVFYIATFIALVSIFQWTIGVSFLTGKAGRVHWRDFFTSPFLVSFIIGLSLFIFQVPIPNVISNSLASVSALNTPLAMMIVGANFAQTDIVKMFKRKSNYHVVLSRLLVIPLLTLCLLMLIPNLSNEMILALLIVAACPAGTNVTVYAQMYDKDYAYAVETVIITTFLSVISLPLIISLYQLLIGH